MYTKVTKLSHNRKIELAFTEEYPLIKRVIRNLRIVNEQVGSYTVSGTVTLYPNVSRLDPERYEASLDTIVYEGTDIKTVIEFHELSIDIEEYFIRKYALDLENENGTVVHLIESLNNEAI